MTTSTKTPPALTGREMLSKVPEITVWFWVIKILCTTVGESFADWINMTLGVGLELTSVLFTVILAGVLTWQLTLRRYVPFVYWLTVVVVSVAGTLYTDILTDDLGVPLAASTTVFALILGVVFAIWWYSQRTLSIHSITTRRRELFYWLAILTTFALGTASGDWILELTGWSPGISVLLPAGLIIAVVIGWRLGANAVLSFWLAYILTRPLGANLGDWLGFPASDGGLGLGVGLTSIIFLTAILATVIYLSVTRADTVENRREGARITTTPQRERVMIGYFLGVAAIAAGLLVWAAAQPHSTAAASEEGPATAVTLAPGQTATQNFPASNITAYEVIVQDTLARVQAGDQAGAVARVADLEKAWDADQPTLEPLDGTGWSVIDGQIDAVLTSVRATSPDPAAQTTALSTLLATLTP
ncbi:COG4705 family protein [Microbacterium jepli]|uniref:COG4705 family protein n=1 Tax=Microbacterium sp. 1P10UE TaxID=3132288 RepID=UPI0039A0FD69